MLRKAAVNLLRKLYGESCYGRVLMRCCCRRLRAGRSQVFVLSCFLWLCLSRVFLCVLVFPYATSGGGLSQAPRTNPRDFLLVLFGMVLLFCDVFCLLLFSLWFCCMVELSAISCCPAMFSLWCFCTAFSPSKRRDFVFSLSLSFFLQDVDRVPNTHPFPWFVTCFVIPRQWTRTVFSNW